MGGQSPTSMGAWRNGQCDIYYWRDERLRRSDRRSMPGGEHVFRLAFPRIRTAVCCDAWRRGILLPCAEQHLIWNPAWFCGELYRCGYAVWLRQESKRDSTLPVHMPRSGESISEPAQTTCWFRDYSDCLRNERPENQATSSRVVARIERKRHASIHYCPGTFLWCTCNH